MLSRKNPTCYTDETSNIELPKRNHLIKQLKAYLKICHNLSLIYRCKSPEAKSRVSGANDAFCFR